MPRVSKKSVDQLTGEVGKTVFLWDEVIPGFGVKLLPSGKKRYILKYRCSGGGRSARQRWLTIGTHGSITPDQARRMAQIALADIASGNDPQGDKMAERNAATMKELWTRFEGEHLPSRKWRTQDEYRSHWKNKIEPELGTLRCKSINRNDVDRFHKSMRKTPYLANRALALLSRLMSLAEVWNMRPQNSNPCRGVERFREQPRCLVPALAGAGFV